MRSCYFGCSFYYETLIDLFDFVQSSFVLPTAVDSGYVLYLIACIVLVFFRGKFCSFCSLFVLVAKCFWKFLSREEQNLSKASFMSIDDFVLCLFACLEKKII